MLTHTLNSRAIVTVPDCNFDERRSPLFIRNREAWAWCHCCNAEGQHPYHDDAYGCAACVFKGEYPLESPEEPETDWPRQN
jgi:hypothetical protein